MFLYEISLLMYMSPKRKKQIPEELEAADLNKNLLCHTGGWELQSEGDWHLALKTWHSEKQCGSLTFPPL